MLVVPEQASIECKTVLVATDGSDFKVTGADVQGGPNKVTFRELPEKERVVDRFFDPLSKLFRIFGPAET